MVRDIKEDRPVSRPPVPMLRYLAGRLAEEYRGTPLEELFDDPPSLVPVPRSSSRLRDGLWPALEIAKELCEAGLGIEVLECLERATPVAKSAFASSGERPSPLAHYESLACTQKIPRSSRLCLVDDVVTRGATLLAAARHLREIFTDHDVFAFAAVRTLGLQPEISEILDPCVGTIEGDGESVRRSP